MVKKKAVSTAMRCSTSKMPGPQLLENLNSGRSDHLDMSDKIMTKYPIFLIISAIGNSKVSIFIWVCTRFTVSAVVWCRNLHFSSLSCAAITLVGRDSVVGIAARYGLDSPGIESRWGRDSPHLSKLALKPYTMSTVSSRG